MTSQIQLARMRAAVSAADKEMPAAKAARELAAAYLAACAAGDCSAALACLTRGAPVDTCDASGTTAVAHATRGGHLDTMRALISAGAHIHGAHGQRPALCWAADAGQLPALQLLLSGSPASKARVNERDAFGFTALLDAARGGHVAIVEALLAAGADVNAQTATGSSALIFAAGDNNGALVAALLRAQPAPTLALATAAGYTAERTARVSGHMALALHLHGLAKAV